MGDHSPIRSCVGCGKRDSKQVLQRFAAGPNGFELEYAQGRGGYLHNREDCWRAFLKRKSLYRAFRRDMSLEEKEVILGKLRRRWSEK